MLVGEKMSGNEKFEPQNWCTKNVS